MRFLALRFFLIFASAALVAAAQPQPPSNPPAPLLKVLSLGGTDYVKVTDMGALLGLKVEWLEAGHRLALKDKNHTTQIELSIDTYDAKVQGQRFFVGDIPRIVDKEMYVSRIDAERSLMPKLRPDLMASAPRHPHVIVIDPGHGGSDPGKENKELNLQEKVLTLDVAFRLKKILTERGFKVILTREKDEQLGPTKTDDFKARALIANQAAADLFVSIHFNSLGPDTKTSGTEVLTFTPQFQRSREATSTGAQDAESEASPVNRFDSWSSLLAQSVQTTVLDQLKTVDRGHKTMHSALMRRVECPSILVESLFLSNDREARLVADPAYRQKIAEAISLGIFVYVTKVDALAK